MKRSKKIMYGGSSDTPNGGFPNILIVKTSKKENFNYGKIKHEGKHIFNIKDFMEKKITNV